MLHSALLLAILATTGTDSSVGGFCLESSGRRILYEQSENAESTLMGLELASGKTHALVEEEGGFQKRRRLLQGCVPLPPVSPGQLNLRAEPRGKCELEEVTKPPLDRTSFHHVCRQRLELFSGENQVDALELAVCAFGQPVTVALTAVAVPGKPLALVMLTYRGQCYESGYDVTSVRLVPSAASASLRPASTWASAPSWLLLEPSVDVLARYQKAAAALIRSGNKDAAKQYEDSAAELRERYSRSSDVCFDSAANRILSKEKSPDSGSTHWVSFDVAMHTTFVACATEHCELLKSCRALRGVRLSELGLSATVSSAGPPRLPAFPDDPSEFVPRCPQRLAISRSGNSVFAQDFEVDCHRLGATRDSTSRGAAPVMEVLAYPVPGGSLVFLRRPQEARATEFGMFNDQPFREPKVRPEPRTWALLDLPPLNLGQILHSAGMGFYRQGRFDSAVKYFEAAFTSSSRQFLQALFNQAATLARQGHFDGAIDALTELLSFSAQRAQYAAKVRKDSDFDALRGDPRLGALLADKRCCTQRTGAGGPVVSIEGQVNFEPEYQWSEGRAHLIRTLGSRDGGSTVEEWDYGRGRVRTYFESGQLKGEGALRDVQLHGVFRHYAKDGGVLSEELYGQ